MRVILNIYGDIRNELMALWGSIYNETGLVHFSEDAILLYESGFRAIVSEVISYQLEFYTGRFRSYLDRIDIGAVRYIIEGGHTLTVEDVLDSADNGSSLAEDIIECFEALPHEVQDAKEFDQIVGNSIYVAYPSIAEFTELERLVFDHIHGSKLYDDFGGGAYVVTVRPRYTRVIISSVVSDRFG